MSVLANSVLKKRSSSEETSQPEPSVGYDFSSQPPPAVTPSPSAMSELRRYEMEDIRQMYDAGVDDIEALMYGRQSFTPDALVNAAAASVMFFGGANLDPEFKASVDPELEQFFRSERGQAMATDTLLRHKKGNRLFFKDPVNPQEAKARREQLRSDFAANGAPTRKAPGFAGRLLNNLDPDNLTAVSHASAIAGERSKPAKVRNKKLTVVGERPLIPGLKNGWAQMKVPIYDVFADSPENKKYLSRAD